MPAHYTLTLDDGRIFGFATFGDPDGVPVIALHGTPGSRFKFADCDERARKLGLRLVSIDRWGYGLSAPNPRGTLAGFGRDMVEFADRLGLGRCLVTGVSGGGPFAVATAAALGCRSIGLALVSPIGLIDKTTPLSAFHAVCFHVLPPTGFAIPAAFQLYRFCLGLAPNLTVRLALSLGPRVDRRALDDDTVRSRLIETFANGLRPGVGGADTDMRLFVRPWDVDLASIRAPARLWIGSADRNVPQDGARKLAAALPACDFVHLDGEGHLWIARHSGIGLEWLAAQASADGDDRAVRSGRPGPVALSAKL